MSIADKITQINTSMDEAVTAQQAGDYSTALSKAETAYLLVTGLPSRMELEKENLEWDPDKILKLLQYLKTRANSSADLGNQPSALMQFSNVRYTRDRCE